MKLSKRIILPIVLMCGALCLNGCEKLNAKNNTEEVEEDKRATVKVDTPKKGNISIEGDFIGTIESEEQVYVMSKLSGDVTETFFEVGDYVNEGDLLFTIDDTAAQISYKQAQASLTSANATLNTAKAGVNTANANVNYQTASVTENFAKASTTDKQLQLGIDQAEVNFANNEVNIGNLESTLKDLNKQLENLDSKIDGAKAGEKLAKMDLDYKKSMLEADPTNLVKLADYEAADAIYTQAKAAVISAEQGRDTLKSSIKQTEAGIRTAKNSNCLIVEQAEIARDQKSDYDNYTKATIGNGGLASLASAQAGVVQAEA
ncbi:MAG: biotin/lipoyl-binding protein, partial [Lachnospiraceae bacterium]|nr:biotin/lipoyl-binding protein [Lachnospiraceae bacterium]